jgi:hypothetical protein
MAGGKGNDALRGAGEAAIVALNADEGNDRLTGSGGDVTVSLGADIDVSTQRLRRKGAALVLETGRGSTLTFADWYRVGPRGTTTLQSIATPTSDQAVGIRRFDFDAWVADFDAAQSSDGSFDPAVSLLSHEQVTAPTAVTGGEIAYRYALVGTLAGMDIVALQAVLSDPGFALQPQAVAAPVGPEFATLAEPQLPLNEAIAPRARPNELAATGVPSENATTVTANNIETPPAASAYAAWFAQTAKQNPFEHPIESAQAAFDVPAPALDDAQWLQRQWAAVHRWLEHDIVIADDLGAPAGFSAARISLAVPYAHEAFRVRWPALDPPSAANGLKPFEGLSDGFARLG